MATDTDIQAGGKTRRTKKPASEAIAVGKKFGKYDVIKKIGSGGMGAVYLAKDLDLIRTVALKILPREKAENPTLVKRFRAEARSAAQLQHENIVSIYESGEIDGLNYLALEYVDGIDVHQLIHRRERLSYKRSLEIVKQIASALDHAHQINIVHRDIKPSNLLITKEGVVKLTDMGLARSMDEEAETGITRAGTTVGTVDYMAPEQARSSKAADIRSDIYSLGCTWYHMLTGVPPYGEGSMTNKLHSHAAAKIPDPRAINESVPETIVGVLTRMMAKKPADRYQTPKELLEDLTNSNLRRAQMSNEGLKALASEIDSKESSTKINADGSRKMPPKAQRVATVNADGDGLGISPDIIKLVVIGVVVVGLGYFLWQTISGFGSAIANNNQTQTANPFDNATGSENGGPSGTAPPTIDGDNPKQGNGISVTPSVPSIPFIRQQPKPDGVANGFNQRWEDLDDLKIIKLENKPNAGSVDAELQAALLQLPAEGGLVEFTKSDLYVLTMPLNLKGKKVVFAAAPKTNPTILLRPGSNGNTTGSLEIEADNVLIRGLHFAMLGEQHENDRSLPFLTQNGTGIIDVQNCTFTLEGTRPGPTTVIHINESKPHTSSSFNLLTSVVRGDGLTAISSDSRWMKAAVRSSMMAIGSAPAIRLESVQPKIKNSGKKSTFTREIDLRRTAVFALTSAVQIEHTGESQQPRTRITTERCRIQRVVSENDAYMTTIQNWQQTDPFKPGASRLDGFEWVTDKCLLAGWDKLLAAETINTGLLYARNKKEWQDLLQSTVIGDLSSDDKVTPDDIMDFDYLHPNRLNSGLVGDSKKPESVTEEFFRRLPAAPYRSLERMFLEATRTKSPSALEDFTDAPVVNIKLDRRKDLGVELSKTTLPNKAIVRVTGEGIQRMSPIHLLNKSIRLEFAKPETGNYLILLPKTIGLRGLARNKEKFETLIDLQNSVLEVQNGVFQIPATKGQTTPAWFLTAKNSGFKLKGTYVTGPNTNDERHRGLILWPESPGNIPEKKRTAIVQDCYLMSQGVVFDCNVQNKQAWFQNSLLTSLSDSLRVTLPKGKVHPNTTLNFHQCTFSAPDVAFRMTTAESTQSRQAPLNVFVESCLFAPPVQMDNKTLASAAVVTSPEFVHAEAIQWWETRNAYSAGVPALLRTKPLTITQAVAGFNKQWGEFWGFGHIDNSIFGASSVLMKSAVIRRQGLIPSDFSLSERCKAYKWNPQEKPVGANVKELDLPPRNDGKKPDKPRKPGDGGVKQAF